MAMRRFARSTCGTGLPRCASARSSFRATSASCDASRKGPIIIGSRTRISFSSGCFTTGRPNSCFASFGSRNGSPGRWKEIHEAYKFALMRGLAMNHKQKTSTAEDAGDARDTASTLEQQYIRLLLLEVLNNGQFSPRDALWADGWFSRWAKALRLEWRESANGARAAKKGFVVDLDGTDGLRRAANAAPAQSPLSRSDATGGSVRQGARIAAGHGRAARIHDAGDARREDRAAEQAKNHLRPRARPDHASRRARAGCARDPGGHRPSEHHPDPARGGEDAREGRADARASARCERIFLDANTFSPLGAATDSPAPLPEMPLGLSLIARRERSPPWRRKAGR